MVQNSHLYRHQIDTKQIAFLRRLGPAVACAAVDCFHVRASTIHYPVFKRKQPRK
jgi:hypothetical protein